MDVEIVYFEGCPNVDVARARIAHVLQGRDDSRMRLRLVMDESEAREARMHGSPTILVDGVDVFAPADAPISWTCRYYPPDVGSHGVPSIEHLERILSAGV